MATHITACFSIIGKQVVRTDCDPQRSGSLRMCYLPAAMIPLVTPKQGVLHVSRDTSVLVVGAPAAIAEQRAVRLPRRANHIVIPVLSAPLYIQAAKASISRLSALVVGTAAKSSHVTTVTNQIQGNTVSAVKLQSFWKKMTEHRDDRAIRFIHLLRQIQNCMRAAQRGLGVCGFTLAVKCYNREQQWLQK